MTYTIWPAASDDLETVMKLLHDRVQWLRERGSDQWSTYKRWQPEMATAITEHRTWLLRDDKTFAPLGTITVGTDGDPEFWTSSELQQPALYLAKLATAPSSAGLGLGRLLLDFSLYLAVAHGLHTVRMDVWRTANDLHTYYRNQGWDLVRTVELPHRYSGTLFQKNITPPDINLPPKDLEIRPPGGDNPPTPILAEPSRYWPAY